MVLQQKITVIFLLTFSAILLGSYFTFNAYWMDDFAELENAVVTGNLDSCHKLLESEAERIRCVLNDYAAWEQSCKFLEDRNERYRRENFIREVLSNLKIDFFCLCGVDGEWFDGVMYERQTDSLAEKVPELLKEFVNKHKRNWTTLPPGGNLSGFVRIGNRLAAVAAAPVTDETREGKVHGYMLMGRFFDLSRLRELQDISGMTFNIGNLELENGGDPGGHHLRPVGDEHIHANRAIVDIFGKPVQSLELIHPRSIYQYGKRAVNGFFLWFALSSLVIFAIIMYFIHRNLLAPLRRATRQLDEYLKSRFPTHRDLQIGHLPREPLPELIEMTHEAAELLRQATRANEQLLMDVPVAIVLIDKEKVIKDINKVALRTIGYESPDEVIGRKCHEVFCPNMDNCMLDNGESLCEETTMRVRDGHVIPIMKTAARMQINNEDCVLVGFFDLSESRHANGKMLEYQRRLDLIMRELKTAADSLEEEKIHHLETRANLEKAQEQARMFDRLKTAFLANISHEVRTPLNTLLGFAELMLDEKLSNEDRKKHFAAISSSATSLLSTINEIISLSRLESGEAEFGNENINVTAEIKELFALWRGKATEHLEFHLLLPETHGHASWVKGDREWFRVALGHLLDNAFKFTAKGMVEFGYAEDGGDRKSVV